MTDGNIIQSVAKAMQLLEVLSQARRSMSLTELSRMTGWPRSTVFGLLTTMRQAGVISQREDGRYALGLKLFEYGCAVSSSWNISNIARPYMARLCAETDASVVLSIYDSGDVVILDQAEGHGSFRIVLDLGSRLPLHATSQGKLFLSAMSPSAVAQVFSEPLTLYTPHTISDLETISGELEQIRQNGYAIENGEYKIGLRSVSAPIYNLDGALQYTISIIGMFRRIQSEEFQHAIELAVAAAHSISLALGHRE